MFETMQSFLAFFFPTLALIILGILFEEKLIAFEERLAQRLFGKKNKRSENPPARRPERRPALRKVEQKQAPRRGSKNRAA